MTFINLFLRMGIN